MNGNNLIHINLCCFGERGRCPTFAFTHYTPFHNSLKLCKENCYSKSPI